MCVVFSVLVTFPFFTVHVHVCVCVCVCAAVYLLTFYLSFSKTKFSDNSEFTCSMFMCACHIIITLN